MGQYDFTYEISDNFHDEVIRFLQLNEKSEIAQSLLHCKIDYNVLDLAYYEGFRGDVWNKKAVEFTIEGSEKNIKYLKSKNNDLENVIHKVLKPNISGFLLKNIEYYISDSEFEIELPEKQGESFEILSRDIHDAINKNEPTLVLDRLHTYSTKLFRGICQKHNISIADNHGNNYPLHSLIGMIVKYYKENEIFESEFVEQAIKMSISTFEKYNDIRNGKSYAHDNDVLNKSEAAYVVSIITATLTLINSIEE